MDSSDHTMRGSAAAISRGCTTRSWWTVPRCSATRRAAARSGLPARPTAKVRSPGTRRASSAQMALESSPPERKAPTGTSAMRCRSTERSSAARTARTCASAGRGSGSGAGTEPKRVTPVREDHSVPGASGCTSRVPGGKAFTSEAKTVSAPRRPT